jgi:23S rRNA G2069 N7-methylase RlmK/C1962 C5-methylase RlmI
MSESFADKAEMLGNRLRKRKKHLLRWAKREGTDCFRLYDRDIPEIPLAVDWYAGHLQVAVWDRKKKGVDDAEEDAWVDAMVSGARAALEVAAERVAVKRRERQKGSAQYERLQASERRFFVHEGGHRFWVNLWDYLDSGLFLDHRETRAMVAQESPGKRVLNLFGYTGSFGVYAAGAGAARVVQVDLSNTYLAWARDNLALNDLVRSEDELVRADTFSYLDGVAGTNERFDLVVVDPPTFSNSKRMANTFDVRRDHPELLRAVLRVLAPRGVIVFSTNARGFSLEVSSLGRVTVEDVTEQTRSPDFEGRHSHRAWRLLPHD